MSNSKQTIQQFITEMKHSNNPQQRYPIFVNQIFDLIEQRTDIDVDACKVIRASGNVRAVYVHSNEVLKEALLQNKAGWNALEEEYAAVDKTDRAAVKDILRRLVEHCVSAVNRVNKAAVVRAIANAYYVIDRHIVSIYAIEQLAHTTAKVFDCTKEQMLEEFLEAAA